MPFFFQFRYSKKHLLLAGLWYAKVKPFMLTFLRPVVDQLNHLYKEGTRFSLQPICNCFPVCISSANLQVSALHRSVPLIRPPILYTTSSPKWGGGGAYFRITHLVFTWHISRTLQYMYYVILYRNSSHKFFWQSFEVSSNPPDLFC